MAGGIAGDLVRTKSLERLHADAHAGEHTLQRTLGPWSLIGLGIGAVIGAGLFSLTGIAAAQHAGPAVVISFAIAALGCAFAGMCYSEMAGMIPVAGSAYTYAYATMGEFVAWIIGWDLVLEYAVGAATVSVSWSQYVTRFLHQLGIDLPAALVHSPFETYKLADGTMAHGLVNLPAILIIVGASALLMIGIRESAKVNAIVVAIKLAVVAIVIGVGLFYVKAQNYVPFIPENTGTFGEYGWSGIMRAAGVVFFAYIGFDAVSTAAQEAKNPQRNMMIGILGSLAICTVIYILFAGVLTGLVHYDAMRGDAAPVNTAIAQTPFPWLKSLVTLGIIAGFSTVILVLLLGQSRVFYTMSQDRLLPGLFSRIHPTWKTPYRSNLFFMVFTGALGGFLPISQLGHMTSIGTLLAFVLVCLGVIILRRTQPDAPRAYRTPLVPLVPILGILSCGAMMVSLDGETWLRLAVWLAIGLAIYFGWSRRHSRIGREEKAGR
ncbi:MULTISPECIES: amino acid permease [Methylobacterium]|uniref:Amino acid permease YhdG n=3 Tax=Pseudomonadota TaxID=1224 RepID=A0ABQ4SP66_9HYPH|nr:MULTISPECIES: amino acid permease [Methylobacterium]PIU04377.1 MAG: amino acid transporter [Methylobacterium sp. CG09_land_8_20_14_0_10_71_15]PIU15819.1 MAG: amino acid transporter [Methylobacterium sp. CG08_land_8_20_14_0_20_71_15]GBU18365.1 putrescine importer [Methylobacterium sp.]GJE04942.1 putative amino acid permease YhdG [Methylobacterium jeotgali]